MKFIKLTGLSLCILALVAQGACKKPPENLVAPAGVSLFLSANPASIPSNGGVSTITVLIFDVDGGPIEDNKRILFDTNLGSIESEVLTSGGKAIAHLTSTGETGKATVTAIANPSVQETVEIEIGEALKNISMTASPATLPSGGGTSSITAVLFGENNRLISGASLVFSTSAGSLSSNGAPMTTNAQGRATDILTTSETAQVDVASGDSSVSGSITVTVEGSRSPSDLVLVADKLSLPEGGGTVRLTAIVFDTDGDLLPGVAVVFKTDAGTLANNGVITTNSRGEASNTLTTTADAKVTAQTATGTTTLSDSVDIDVTATPAPQLYLRLTVDRQSIDNLGTTIGADACNTNHPQLPLTVTGKLTDDDGVAVTDRDVIFWIDASSPNPYGNFCPTGQSVVSTTDSFGEATVAFTMDDTDRLFCDEAVDICIADPTSCLVCTTVINAASGSVLAEEVLFIDALCQPADTPPDCDPS